MPNSAKLAAAFTLTGVLTTLALLLACEWVLLNGLFDAVPRAGPPPTLSALATRLPDAMQIAVLLGAPAGLLASAALTFYVRRYGAIDIALGGGICAQAAALINVVASSCDRQDRRLVSGYPWRSLLLFPSQYRRC